MPVITVQNLSKLYRIGKKRSGSFREAVSDKAAEIFSSKNDVTDFWALKEVSFEVEKGEVLGVIGRNGAGKTTLLKILSRITEPTGGSVTIDGRVSSLLEVGTGFHPELTGRENIFLNGAILGLKRAEIREKFDEIAAFSGVEQFLDTPVKRYSSGMYVRLAFAVAAHLEPEILIVDEVLAVGDMEFQKKCLGKMKDVSEQEGRTVLFVSHNLSAARSLCSKTIVLDSGEKIFEGETDRALEFYLTRHLSKSSRELHLLSQTREAGEAVIAFKAIYFDKDVYYPDSSLVVEIMLKHLRHNHSSIGRVNLAMHIVDADGREIYHLSNLFVDKADQPFDESYRYLFRLSALRLKPGLYRIWLWLQANGLVQDVRREGIVFEVQEGSMYDYPSSHIISGSVQPDFEFLINAENNSRVG